MSNNELLKQWEQDVADYGDNAYLMWEISENSRWCQLQSNLPATIKSEQWRFRRKQSAALPFDLELSQKGDVVEIQDLMGWCDCKSKTFEVLKHPLVQLDNTSVSVFNDLARNSSSFRWRI